MCELLGMDCNVPTDILFSFAGFSRRGGRTAHHADGWGLCLYDGRALREFREPHPAATSALADYLRTTPIKTKIAIAHIRKLTSGRLGLANTHPFTRELWGRQFAFAHNGTMKRVKKRRLGRFRPVGNTDSEHAFCWMLEQLRARFKGYPSRPRALFEAVAELSSELARDGTFNFVMSDAKFLFARCHTLLSHIVRQHPFSTATLADADLSIDFSKYTTTRDRVAVVATRPLTRDETWTIGKPGTLWVFHEGALRATLESPAPRAARPRV